MKNLFKVTPIQLVVYLIWLTVHVILYSRSGKGFSEDYFWPFTTRSLEMSYDGLELFVYLVVPVLGLFIYNLKNDVEKSSTFAK